MRGGRFDVPRQSRQRNVVLNFHSDEIARECGTAEYQQTSPAQPYSVGDFRIIEGTTAHNIAIWRKCRSLGKQFAGLSLKTALLLSIYPVEFYETDQSSPL